MAYSGNGGGGSGSKRKGSQNSSTDGPIRVRTPRANQVLGIIEERLGNRRSKVRCSDGFIRVCRIPGRVRKRIWTREGDIVIIEPWSVQTSEKGDLIWTYSKPQVDWLRRNKYLDWL